MHWTSHLPLVAIILTSSTSLATQTAPLTPNVSAKMPAAEFADSVGGSLETSMAGPALKVLQQIAPRVYHCKLYRTGTGWNEEFILVTPSINIKRPVLVFWHKFSTSVFDVKNTTFIDEALAREWYLVAPLGAHQQHFGIDYAQENIRVLMCHLGNWLNLAPNLADFDEQRIYGVGFSMGGGALTAYASRHLDPTEYPYAAIVNHTGTMSIAPLLATNPTLFNHPLMFGSPLKAARFRYIIASSIYLYPDQNTVNGQTNLIRNVPSLHMRTFTATGDSHDNVSQCAVFDNHTQNILGYPGFMSWTALGNGHTWSTLDEAQTCDYLSTHTFTRPTGRTRILADRDARYYDISVKLVNDGELCPFEFDVTGVPTNSLALQTSRKTRELEIHTNDMGLNPFGPITINLSGPVAPPAPITLKVHDIPVAAATATRTPPHPGSSFSLSPGGIMTIVDPDPGSNPTWTIP